MKISLKAARVNAGLTQKDVCNKLKITEKTLIDWERGNKEIKTISLIALCSVYGIEVDDILCNSTTL